MASEELLAVVRNALNDEDVRPVADRVTVQSANIVDYSIAASLFLFPGPESEPVLSAARAVYEPISRRSIGLDAISASRPFTLPFTLKGCRGWS